MLFPIIDPDRSITMTRSFGLEEACIYHIRRRQSYRSVCVLLLIPFLLPGYIRNKPTKNNPENL